ncbi:MAG: ABC transporter permease [Acidimicrobiales bacterium]
MNQLIRAELLKFRTTRTAFWMLIGLPVSVLLSLASTIALADREGASSVATVEGVRNVLSGAASSGTLLVMILGIIAMTGEYRYQTVTQTFLVCPARGRVVAAKLVTYALLGLFAAIAAGALTIVVGLPWLAAEGAHPRMLHDVGLVLAGATAATVLYGALGVAIGALMRNQTAAIVLTLAWMFLLEGLFVTLRPALGRWLPGGAASALSSFSVEAGDLLPMWGAALVLVAYACAFAMAGSRVIARRDVA